MRFAHLADCHLGGWRHPELQQLNFESFKYALNICKRDKIDFVLIAGDLFDSAYPPIETIKDTFEEFRKLKESNIPVFLIAGSHDYSVSGKSFLDVLEKAGFATNVTKNQERNGDLILEPTIYKNVAIYGFPGKKTGLEVYDLERIKLQDSPGLFKILMLHTTLKDALPGLDIPSVDASKLPKVDYTALGHLHLFYEKERRVYGGPIYPNNASELEDLKYGTFYICSTSGEIKRHEIKIKDVLTLDFEIKDSLIGTDYLIEELKKQNLKDKILILKLKGVLERGKVTDIDFNKLETFSKTQGVYSFLKNTTKLIFPIAEIDMEYQTENFEENIISNFRDTHPHKYNELIPSLLNILNFEKKEDELSRVFDDRLFSDLNKVLFP
ncbi:exonuclease SbcCD subunit D [Candidatus Pacearchaeota archaeon]|nr:exonuclease SbcCD subunit D [Candidatus Pacearchaeota archaeon]